jgi:hypothetical protein
MASPVTCDATAAPGVGPDYNRVRISGKIMLESYLKTIA